MRLSRSDNRSLARPRYELILWDWHIRFGNMKARRLPTRKTDLSRVFSTSENPKRSCVPKPRLARHELPWVTVRQTSPTATRLRPTTRIEGDYLLALRPPAAMDGLCFRRGSFSSGLTKPADQKGE